MNGIFHRREWMRNTPWACLALGLLGGAGHAAAYAKRTSGPSHGAAPSPDAIASIPTPTRQTPTDRAIAKRIAMVRRSPGDAHAWVNLGDILMQHVRETADSGYYDRAERVYRKALLLDPKDIPALIGMAWVNSGRHQFSQSVVWAKKAIVLDPENQDAVGLIGDADVEQGNYAAAFGDYQKMLNLRPDISSYSRGAHLLFITGQSFRAEGLMRQAIQCGAAFAENTAWCRAQLALMYFGDGNLPAAEQTLDEALQITPSNRHVLAAMGKVKAALNEYQDAIGFYEKASAIAPEQETLVALGDLYALTGRKEEAEKQYALVEALHRIVSAASHVTFDFPIAQFYADHDRNLSQALRLAEKNKQTKNVFEEDILAWCYYKNKQPRQAMEAIDRALRLQTPDARFLYHAGMIYADAGDGVSAQKFLYRALSLNPNFSPTLAPNAVAMLTTLSHRLVDGHAGDPLAQTAVSTDVSPGTAQQASSAPQFARP